MRHLSIFLCDHTGVVVYDEDALEERTPVAAFDNLKDAIAFVADHMAAAEARRDSTPSQRS